MYLHSVSLYVNITNNVLYASIKTIMILYYLESDYLTILVCIVFCNGCRNITLENTPCSYASPNCDTRM